jgi:hypothetical protein
MACGCSKGSIGTPGPGSVYIYTSPTGQQSSWPTKYEAEYAKLRSGGGGSIRVEAKK